MRFLEDAERELREMRERHAREEWALVRRLLAASHENGRKLGRRPDVGRPAPEPRIAGWIEAREPRSIRASECARKAAPLPAAKRSPTRFRLPWAKEGAQRTASR